jgi:hypothetical protein
MQAQNYSFLQYEKRLKILRVRTQKTWEELAKDLCELFGFEILDKKNKGEKE